MKMDECEPGQESEFRSADYTHSRRAARKYATKDRQERRNLMRDSPGHLTDEQECMNRDLKSWISFHKNGDGRRMTYVAGMCPPASQKTSRAMEH